MPNILHFSPSDRRLLVLRAAQTETRAPRERTERDTGDKPQRHTSGNSGGANHLQHRNPWASLVLNQRDYR